MGIAFKKCPKSWLMNEGAESMLWIHDHKWLVDHHVMPCPGGLMDQENRWVEAVNIIESEIEIIKRISHG